VKLDRIASLPGCEVDPGGRCDGEGAGGGHQSLEAWQDGRNAIVLVWDENDYGSEPNQVVTIVDTSYGKHGVTSQVAYNHFSLLKTIEAAFNLPYLNHAADKNVPLMKDLFAR